jgi:hypothetical protein
MQPDQPIQPLGPKRSDIQQVPVSPAPSNQTAQPTSDKLVNHDKLRWFKEHKAITLSCVAVILLVPIGVLAFIKLRHHPKPAPAPVAEQPAAAPAAPPPTSPLTGAQIAPGFLDTHPVFGVVIENSPEARPQSGLSQAGVVYEALAEGGITRFLAMFLDEQPTTLGPVRSLRPYFVDWSQEYSQAPVAHAGGSFDALNLAQQIGMKSMNGLNYGSYFTRTRDRFSPHNLYTSAASLIKLMSDKGWTTKANFAGWARKPDAPEAAPSHPTITCNFSYPLFTSKYQYDAASNSYSRFIAGNAHIERNTGKQIVTKNVVAMYLQTSYDGSGHALMQTIGSGKAVIFRDGGAIVGTWNKASARTTRTKFLDASGAEIPLNVGNTWICVIPQTGSATY